MTSCSRPARPWACSGSLRPDPAHQGSAYPRSGTIRRNGISSRRSSSLIPSSASPSAATTTTSVAAYVRSVSSAAWSGSPSPTRPSASTPAVARDASETVRTRWLSKRASSRSSAQRASRLFLAGARDAALRGDPRRVRDRGDDACRARVVEGRDRQDEQPARDPGQRLGDLDRAVRLRPHRDDDDRRAGQHADRQADLPTADQEDERRRNDDQRKQKRRWRSASALAAAQARLIPEAATPAVRSSSPNACAGPSAPAPSTSPSSALPAAQARNAAVNV